MEEEKSQIPSIPMQYCSTRILSSEIVEISEESRSIANSRDGGVNDVYVAVGKNDLHVLKWALEHAVSPGARVFLVHVFPPLTYIPTPIGRLSRSQLSQDQVRCYTNEEHNRRRNLLQKYIRLCNDAKVNVETMLLESNEIAKAILDLIPVLNINNMIMGSTRLPPRSRLLRKKLVKAEFVKKNAPDYCEITTVDDGRKTVEVQQAAELEPSSQRPHSNPESKRKFFECVRFSVCRKNIKDALGF